jgi:hypothetical protein
MKMEYICEDKCPDECSYAYVIREQDKRIEQLTRLLGKTIGCLVVSGAPKTAKLLNCEFAEIMKVKK